MLSRVSEANDSPKLFSSRRYLAALACWSAGIRHHPSSPSLHQLYLNRSLGHFKIERFSLSLADADSALALLRTTTAPAPPLVEKALARRAKALYALRRWPQALAAYGELVAASPALPDVLAGLAACQARMAESSSGEAFDVAALYRASLAGPTGGVARIDDAADFIGEPCS